MSFSARPEGAQTERSAHRPSRLAARFNGLGYYGLSLGFAFFFLFPLLIMLVSAFKSDELQLAADLSSWGAFIPYGTLGLANFGDVYDQVDFNQLLLNSVFIVGTTVGLGLLVNSFIAYALARFRFRGKRLLLSLIVALIVIPFEAVVIPLLLWVSRLPWPGSGGWLDTYQVQILPFAADAFYIYLFYQFFVGLPAEIEEAALIDGANRWQIYWNILLPLSGPVFSTVAILSFIQRWSDYLWPLLVTRGPRVRPLMVGFQQFFARDIQPWGDIMAFATLITAPVMLLFLIFQRWFVHSIATYGYRE